MNAYDEIYIYPIEARKKMKVAQEQRYTVYVYGVTGIGKTILIQNYLKNKKYQYFDAAKVTAEELDIPKSGEVKTVVVDNLHFADIKEIQECILKLTGRSDIWLILLGRGKNPSWLLGACLKYCTIMKISQDDLYLSKTEIEKYFELHGILLEESSVDEIIKRTGGNGLYLKHLRLQIMWQGKKTDGKICVLDDAIWTEMERETADYLEREVFEQWDIRVTEFFMQMSIVERFNLKLAQEISGRHDAECIIEHGFEIGDFLEKENNEYCMMLPMRKTMQKILNKRYSKEQKNELYYNAGRYYMQEGKTIEALQMFEICENTRQISQILIENARMNPGSGYLYQLRHYYKELPEEIIEDSLELISGMSMLSSMLLNIEESERWYEKLKEKEMELNGSRKKSARGWLAYLDIGLPHRDNKNIIELFKNVGVLITNREVTFPELSVTSNAPSQMNGGKDFCEWSKKDKELATSLGKVMTRILGRAGAGFVDLALAESYFEKGEDDYEVVRLISTGQMQAESKGRLEQIFVAVGLMVAVHIISGQIEDAQRLLTDFKQRIIRENADKFLPNIENLFCRMYLYKGEKTEIAKWLQKAPSEVEEFYTFDRYMYLTKIRVYILYGKYTQAQSLIEKMFYYADVMHRTYIQMECELLLAILQYRIGYAKWKETLQSAYTHIEEYHFVRLISREGIAILNLLKEAELNVQDEKFYKQVLMETKRMAEYYPSYLKDYRGEDEVFPENAIRILRLQAEGMSYEAIAKQLGITSATVKYHCKQTYKKLGVSGKAAAVTEARKRKLI